MTNFTLHVSKTGKPSHPKLFTTAVATFYDFGFGFDIKNPGGVKDSTAFFLRQRAITEAPKQVRPLQADDLGRVRDGLCKSPPIADQSLSELVRTVAVLSRMLAGADRPSDLVSTCFSADWMETEWDPTDGRSFPVTRYDTKTRKNKWLVFDIHPLDPKMLAQAFGWSRQRAESVVSHCCLAKAWKTYVNMVKEFVRLRTTKFTLGGRRVYARNALIHGSTKLDKIGGTAKFLATDTLSNIIKAFHMDHVGPLPMGSKHVTYWWRHFVLSTLHAIGHPEEAMKASDHTNIRTFKRAYDVPPNPEFMERWNTVQKRRAFSSLPSRFKLLL